jgi:hypothetical protein
MSGLSVAAQTWVQWRRNSWPTVGDSTSGRPLELEWDDRSPLQIYHKFCHACGDQAWRESVDVGVGVIYGPWGCYCGWSEWPEYNQLRSDVKKHTDQFGFYYPREALRDP